MAATLQRLRDDHANMARLLGAFEHQLTDLEEARAPDYDVLDDIIEYCSTYPNRCSLPQELIFSTLLLRDPRWAAAVDDLRDDHREFAVLLCRLASAVRCVRLDAAVSRERFSALARSLLTVYRHYMEMEERLLFTDAARMLTPADWADIDRKTVRALDLPTAETDRLERLRNGILAWDAGL